MTSQHTFWKWFIAHQDELLDFEADREQVFNALSNELAKVHPDLSFEFGPKSDRREFVISASGIRAAFPAVDSLVAVAPKLDRWCITAFRPRRTPLNRIEIGRTRVDPEDVEFSLLTNGSEIGLRLFVPGFSETNVTLKQIAYLMLDEALGEYDVETKIGPIEMLPSESPKTAKRYPLSELPSLFDEYASRLAKPDSII